jgi:hypothetical protein
MNPFSRIGFSPWDCGGYQEEECNEKENHGAVKVVDLWVKKEGPTFDGGGDDKDKREYSSEGLHYFSSCIWPSIFAMASAVMYRRIAIAAMKYRTGGWVIWFICFSIVGCGNGCRTKS